MTKQTARKIIDELDKYAQSKSFYEYGLPVHDNDSVTVMTYMILEIAKEADDGLVEKERCRSDAYKSHWDFAELSNNKLRGRIDELEETLEAVSVASACPWSVTIALKALGE